MLRELITDIQAFLLSMETDSTFRKDSAGYFMEWECGKVVARLRICNTPYLTAFSEGKRVHRRQFSSVDDLKKNYSRNVRKTLET